MVQVACAIIVHKGKILATQRGTAMSMPGKWEFPGGKVEPGETPEACIEREIIEELHIVIKPIERLEDCFFDYGNFQILLLPFISDYISGEIKLSEHQNYSWLIPADLGNLDWAPADEAIVKVLVSRRF